jgi:eukaryotic-like serine/threonine-protein kinase
VYDAIGSGGMATVHLGRLASDEGPRRPVAIKRLRAQFVSEPEVVASFVDEARLAARIRHPNVVATIDIVTDGGEVLLVMEYIDGESLASLVRGDAAHGKRVPPDVAVAIVAGVLRGLHAAHEAVGESGESLRIVHRDVSPQNILVGVDGTARVLDFGVAKALGRQQTTRDGRIKGTLAYMAPEQLSGRGVTRRTDTFAAGIVLWELLTGRRLFRAQDDAQTLTRVLFEPVLPPSKVCPEAPAALDSIVVRALERDPTRRFATAQDMAVALDQALTPAAPHVVGAWVRSVAAEGLEERARRVLNIEQGAATDRGLKAGSGVRSRARGLAAVVSILVVALVGAAGVASLASVARGSAHTAQASSRPSTPMTSASFVSASVPSAPFSPVSLELPAPIATAPLPSAAPLSAPPTRRSSGSRPAPKDPPPRLPVGGARDRLYSQD